MTEGDRHFAFAFARRYRLPLAALGIRPSNSGVTLSSRELVARFGRWTCRSEVANIRGVAVTGPYKGYRAVGPRLSAKDGGLTFGTSTRLGACVCFRVPVPGSDAAGLRKHPGLTLTLADVEDFVAAVRTVADVER